MLCEILTGLPPYTGTSAGEVFYKAQLADLDDARARLDACGADRELIMLANRCLSREPCDRPPEASCVAAELAAYRAGVEQRLRTAERERVAAEAKAIEQRKRRRVQVALFTALLVLALGAGTGAWWWNEQERDRLHRVARNADAISSLVAQCEESLQADDAEKAAMIMAEIERRKNDHIGTEFDARIEASAADLVLLQELDRIDEMRWQVPDGKTLLLARYQGKDNQAEELRSSVSAGIAEHASEWAAAFARYGIVPGAIQADAAAAKVSASPIPERLISALDLWLLGSQSAKVMSVLSAADPDPMRNSVRGALLAGDDAKVVEALPDDELLVAQPRFIVTLAEIRAIPIERMKRIVTAALGRKPADFALLMTAGSLYRVNWNGQGRASIARQRRDRQGFRRRS